MAIVGTTASGKSDLAMRVAEEFNGEIISADSRTIYKGMDIGTAKPSAQDQKTIVHWGIDLVEPGEPYSAGRFQEYAQAAIDSVREKGKLPILVGGTGLYVDGVLYGFEFQGNLSPPERTELEKLTTEQLQAQIKARGFKMPQNDKNRRHLVRTIERQGKTGRKLGLKKGTLLIGLMPDDETLRHRIDSRAQQIFKNGVLEETKRIIQAHGDEALSRTGGIVYKLTAQLLKGEISEEEALSRFKTADWQYARRQRTWFKRNPDIHWFGSAEQAYSYISSALNT